MMFRPNMNAQQKNTSNRGFTLIEALTSLTVSAIILVGLFASVVAILYHYRNDWVVIDMQNYGHIMLEEIGDRMERAQDIEVTKIADNYAIELTDWDGHRNYITAHESEGFTQDNFPLLRGIDLPIEGLYRDRVLRQRWVELINFDCATLEDAGSHMPYAGAAAFEKSVFMVTFTLALTTKYADTDETQTEYFNFTRTVFSSNRYLKLKGVKVGPPYEIS